MRTARWALAMAAALAALAPGAAQAAGPAPGTPEYVQRDNQNMLDAYGRQSAPDGQLSATYLTEYQFAVLPSYLEQVARQAANPTRPILDPGQLVPGWNTGNPYRRGWSGRRGQRIGVTFTNRYGALLRGDVYAPLPGARDPYTGAALAAPYPAVLITTGSVQGSQGMYEWLAQDLAERGYVVLAYDVQGQGTSETLPHQGPVHDFPFCDPTSTPAPGEQTSCPGVPSQQTANFVVGTEDALDFLLATPDAPYPNPAAGSAQVNAFNPLWKLIDRTPDAASVTPGRTSKVAIVGHSLGAAAISQVQGTDARVEAAVALDKLTAGSANMFGVDGRPIVPALGLQSEYGFTVGPYWTMGGSSLAPTATPPTQGPDPRREQRTGFDGWRAAGVDSMVVVPRASTHLEYTDIPFALPASRYGQDVASHYVQAWLDKYLKHDPGADARLLADRLTYLEPTGAGAWTPVTLERDRHLSFYFCSGYGFHTAGGKRSPRSGGALVENRDVAGVGGC